jgi:Type IV secretion system pilin
MTNVKNLLNKAVYGALALMMAMTFFTGLTGNAAPSTYSPCTGDNCVGGVTAGETITADSGTVAEFILGIANYIVFISAAIATLFLIYGGILFIYDPKGSGDNVKKGKTIIFNALIGLVICVAAFTIIQIILGLVGGTTSIGL